MDLIQIANLRAIIDLRYPHVCVHASDLEQFTNIPWEAKRFYKFKGYGNFYEKKGFFHNGKTTVWATIATIKRNHVKIADKEIPTLANGAYWSDDFSFEEEGSAEKIRRIMRLKAFW